MLTKFDRGVMGPHYIDTTEIAAIRSSDSGASCTILIRGGGSIDLNIPPEDAAKLYGSEVVSVIATA